MKAATRQAIDRELRMTRDYRVQLDAFEGPMDLLLYLIRQNEVEITDIPIATIADQYLAFLNDAGAAGMERIDIDLAGEFLLMAATLMEIKSRVLTPRPTGPDGEPEAVAPGEDLDPRADLVRQLLAYKRFRDAAELLDRRRQDWERRYPTAPPVLSDADEAKLRDSIAAEELEIEDLSLSDLLEAFQGILSSVNIERLGDHTVVVDDTPIELHAEDILDRLRHLPPSTDSQAAVRSGIPLSSLFVGRKRGEMLGLFLAVLELVKRRAISIKQDPMAPKAAKHPEIVLSLAEETHAEQSSTPSPPDASAAESTDAPSSKPAPEIVVRARKPAPQPSQN